MTEIAFHAGNANEPIWKRRVQDYLRHIRDLQSQSYEGASDRKQREAVFRTAFDFLTPVALCVLGDINDFFLEHSGEISSSPPSPDREGGLMGSWSIDWPLLRKAVNRFTGEPLKPVSITAIFPLKASLDMQWTHPHLALLREEFSNSFAAAWPMQVTSKEDAERQEPILRVLAEGELHHRTFEADLNWRILPFVMK